MDCLHEKQVPRQQPKRAALLVLKAASRLLVQTINYVSESVTLKSTPHCDTMGLRNDSFWLDSRGAHLYWQN